MLTLELSISSPGWRLMILIVQLHSDISTCMSSPWWQFKHSMCQTELLSMPLWVAPPSIQSPSTVGSCHPWVPHPQACPLYLLCSQIIFSFLASVSLLIKPRFPFPAMPSSSQLASSSVFLKSQYDPGKSLLKMLQWLPFVLQEKSKSYCGLWGHCDLAPAHPLTPSSVIPWAVPIYPPPQATCSSPALMCHCPPVCLGMLCL